jgi:hypothetical protein
LWVDRMLFSLVPAAPEFFFRKHHPPLVRPVKQSGPTYTIRLKNHPERCFYLPLPGFTPG